MKNNYSHGACGGIYGLAFIGSLVYFLHGATTFPLVLMAILKALIWPAILLFHLLQFLHL
jgi:hypothetical protein